MPKIDPSVAAEFIRLGGLLSDAVFFEIPNEPVFCPNSGGGWRILDAGTLADMQSTNKKYKDTITSIDTIGHLGIGYQLTRLSDDNEALNTVITAWYKAFPWSEFEMAESEMERLQLITDNEQVIKNLDRLLDRCVWNVYPDQYEHIAELNDELDSLKEKYEFVSLRDETLANKANLELEQELLQVSPEENEARIKDIESELQGCDDTLDTLDHEIAPEESLEGLSDEIDTVNKSLLEARDLDADIIRGKSFEWAVYYSKNPPYDDEEKAAAVWLLNSDEESELCVLTEQLLRIITDNAAQDFIERGYKRLEDPEIGQLEAYLNSCRDEQQALYSEAKDALWTEANAQKEVYPLSEHRVRDPIVRTEYIDCQTISDGKDFCDVIIGACLYVVDEDPSLELPDHIKDFIQQQPAIGYSDMLKQKFVQFMNNELDIPKDQRCVLPSISVQHQSAGVLSGLSMFNVNTVLSEDADLKPPTVCLPPLFKS
jgi:hypothetical protein